MGKPSIAGSLARAALHGTAAALSARTGARSSNPAVKVLSAVNVGLQTGLAVDAASDLSKAIDRKQEEKQMSRSVSTSQASPAPSTSSRIVDVIEGGKPGERWKVELYDRYGYGVESISKARKFVFTGIDREYSPSMAADVIKKYLGIDLECRKDFKLYMRKDDSLVFVCKYD